MFGWNYCLALFWGYGAGCAAVALLVKKYSIVWMVTPFVPCWLFLLYNYARQPEQDLENAYRYLIAKRAATSLFERNRSKVLETLSQYPNEKEQLAKYLKNNNLTLYDLEAEVYSKLNSGSL
uniref:Uncharacterized protein n=1 Tax=Euplotes harpa TaxID=151035 RepID=A0A7S3JNK8_9SPIT|mmetsp:Transcript_7588/g.8562  ORF Transcript_7588/g.8562 Transcript_7588/m.8562 type:complete len:122 (+) Transcript_7588:318-683(+)